MGFKETISKVNKVLFSTFQNESSIKSTNVITLFKEANFNLRFPLICSIMYCFLYSRFSMPSKKNYIDIENDFIFNIFQNQLIFVICYKLNWGIESVNLIITDYILIKSCSECCLQMKLLKYRIYIWLH